MTIAVNGYKSSIAQSLEKYVGPTYPVMRGQDMPILGCDRYLFCQGVLYPLKCDEQSLTLVNESVYANFTFIKQQCNKIIAANDFARICVIGSESGFTGSYDGTYADAKRALHLYVENKKLRCPTQQLVCIAPSIIGDAGMTVRRHDTDHLLKRQQSHPKQRFITSDEVARLIHFLLYVDQGYISGVTIRMNGGAHCAG